ncbi:MAG: tetratricopeptide repeat protein [Candidatus Acidiferrales bacterium]
MSESDSETKKVRRSSKGTLSEVLIVTAVLATTLATYIGTIWYSFVYDDDGQIIGNSYIQFWRHVPLYFISHVWAQLVPRANGNYYRPLFLLWLRLNDAVFGLRPAGWHAAAIGMHLLATFLVYLLARKLTHKISVASFAALVFGLHPMHAEVVSWVSGATESLCAVFILAGFLAYLKSREGNTAIWMTISCVLYVFAVFSKETGIVLPLLVFAHCWIYGPVQTDGAEAPEGVRRLLACVRAVLVYVPVALVYLAARVLVLHGLAHPLVRLGFRQVIFTIPSMVGFYVKKWFLPIRLNEFYDMPYWGTLNFWHVILPAVLVVALFAAIWMARNELGAREVKFALFWVIVPLLPVLDSRMLPKDEIVHDRYFYLPSIGAALLVALVVDRWTRAPRGKLVFGLPVAQLVVALVLAAALGGLSVHESQFWANNYTLFHRAYVLAPHNPTGRLDYGAELITRGDFADARTVFDAALLEDPNDSSIYVNLGRMAYEEKDYAAAQDYLLHALAINKNNADAHANLGLAQLRMDHLADALGNMKSAAELRPNDPELLFAYGVALEADNNCSLAADQFRAALDIRPGAPYAETQLIRCQKILAQPAQN